MIAALPEWSVRPLETTDREVWSALYRGYRRFYEMPDDDAVLETTWEWVTTGAHGLSCIVAVDPAGKVAGLAHLRVFADPSEARLGLFLDDLFVDPAFRGNGVGRLLLQRTAQIAADRGANVVRWITASEDNAVARALYDSMGTATPWTTYDMEPAATEPAAVQPAAVG
ncbi:MAG: GNAT family N-acetyltransferase [Burkholderiaceae bacterium]|nr:GNAT family N-acetyltransferase [Microbacteriaceae bacterium]